MRPAAHRPCSLLLLTLLGATACTDTGDKSADSGSSTGSDDGGDEGGEDGGEDGGDDGGDEGDPPDCVTFDYFQTVTEDLTIVPACNPTIVPGPLIVDATITVEAGSELHMGPDSSFSLGLSEDDGALVVEGSAEAPVLFIGRDSTGADNRWDGLDIGVLGTVSTTVEHARFVRCGAREDDGSPRAAAACVRMSTTAGASLVLQDVAFEDASVAVRVSGDTAPTTLAGLDFDATTQVGLVLPADHVGIVQETFPFPNPDGVHRIEDGTTSRVTADARWVGQPVPWETNYDLVVTGDDTVVDGDPGPTLTLEAGFTLALPEGAALEVGTENPAAITTEGTPTSPVQLRPRTEGTRIDGLVLGEALSGADLVGLHLLAGGGASTEGASLRVQQVEDEVEVVVEQSTFEDCAQTGVSTLDADLFRFASFSENTFLDCAAPLILRPDTAASISGDQTWEGDTFVNLLRTGPITRDGSWADLGLPWRFEDDAARGGEYAVDAVLTIAPGSDLRFAEETRITVAEAGAGALVAVGSATAPVSFRAADTEWEGIVFAPGSDGSSLGFAEVGEGGQLADNTVQGCITVLEGATDISIVDSHVLGCGQAGISAIGATPPFASFAGNTLSDLEVGLRLHPNVLVGLAPQTTSSVDHHVVTTDVLTVSGTWQDHGLPFHTEGSGDIEVEADLVIAAGFELAFPWVSGLGTGMEVGEDGTGSLAVAGTSSQPVVFRSAEASPTAGDWRQLWFGSLAQTSTLTFLELHDAGRGGRAAIDLNGNVALVTLTSVSVSNSLGDDLEVD